MIFKKEFVSKIEEQAKRIAILEQNVDDKEKTIQHLTNELKINASELLRIQQITDELKIDANELLKIDSEQRKKQNEKIYDIYKWTSEIPHIIQITNTILEKAEDTKKLKVIRIEKYWENIKNFHIKVENTGLYGLGNCIKNVAYFITKDYDVELAMMYLDLATQTISELVDNKSKTTIPTRSNEIKHKTTCHFSEVAIEKISNKIINTLHQDFPKMSLPNKRIQRLIFDLNRVTFEKGDYERQSLVQKFAHDISNTVPEDAKIGWRIYNDFKKEMEDKVTIKKEIEKDLKDKKSKSIKDSILYQKALQEKKVGRPRISEEMKKDIETALQKNMPYRAIRELICIKYNRKPCLATISAIATAKATAKATATNELGKIVENNIVEWIKENTCYRDVDFFNRVLVKISQALNENKGKIYNTIQIQRLFKDIFNSFNHKKIYPQKHRVMAYIFYFIKDGQLSKKNNMYVIKGNNLIPKQKKQIDIVEEEIKDEKTDKSFIDILGM